MRDRGTTVKVCNNGTSCCTLGNVIRGILSVLGAGRCSVRPIGSSPSFRPNEATEFIISNGILTRLNRVRPAITRGCGVNTHICITRVSIGATCRGELPNGARGPLPGFPTMAHSLTFIYGERVPILSLRGTVNSTINGALRGIGLFSICRNSRVRGNGGDITFGVEVEDTSGALASSRTSTTVGHIVGTLSGLNVDLHS